VKAGVKFSSMFDTPEKQRPEWHVGQQLVHGVV